jgi:hypothetical protein
MPRIPSYPLIGSLSNNDLLVIDDVSQQYATKSVELQSLKGYFNTGQATTTYVNDKVVSGAEFNTNTGVLTLTRTDGVDVTQDLDGRYALTTDVFSGNYNDLTNKPSLFSGNYNDLTNKPTIPTSNSQLANGEGYTNNLGVVQSLETNNTSGAATLIDGVLNIPQYSSGGGGFDGQFSSLTGVPTTIAGYGITDALVLGTTSTTALAGNTTTISTAQANEIAANSLKTSFPGFGTTAGTALEGNTVIPAAYTDADVDAHLNISAAGNNEVLSWTGSDYDWVAQSGGGGGVTSIIAGTGIGVDQSTGDVTITNTGSATGAYATVTRTFSGNELVNAFNGTAGDEIVLVTVPAGYQAILSGDAIQYVDYSTGTTDYTGTNLTLKISALSGTNFITLGTAVFTTPSAPFYITNGQTTTNNNLGTSNLGQNITLISNSVSQRANFTAGDRDATISFTYRLVNLNL